jgi:hypothetical protein
MNKFGWLNGKKHDFVPTCVCINTYMYTHMVHSCGTLAYFFFPFSLRTLAVYDFFLNHIRTIFYEINNNRNRTVTGYKA